MPPDFHPEASSSPMPPEVAVAQELACEHQSIATAPPVTSLPADTLAKAPEGCPPVSPSLSSARLRECQLSDVTISSVLASWFTKPKPQSRPQRDLLQQHPRLFLKDGVLYRRLQDPQRGTVEQLVLPSTLKPDVLGSLHDNMGHQGLDRTTELLRARVYWPGMFGEVRSYIHACQRCAMGRKPAANTTSGHFIASRPLEVLAIDFTKLDQASDGRENVIVMTDVFTKFTQAVPTKNQEAATVAKVLVHEWFLRYGVLERIHSDQNETSSPAWWKSCATPTTSRRPERRRTTRRETPSASVSTAPCTVCCVRCLRSRSPGGPSICRSWSRRTTTRLTPRPASHPTSCSSDRSPDCRWTTCWDVLLALQQGQSTGFDNTASACRRPTTRHPTSWSKLQPRGPATRTREPLTMRSRWATTSTYATACWAATKSRTSGGPSCIRWQQGHLTTCTWLSHWLVALSVQYTAKTLCRPPPLLLSTPPTISLRHRRQTSLTESDSDDELCVLTPQTLAPVAVAVPAVTPAVQRPPVPLPRRSRCLAEKNIIQQ